MAFRIRHHNHGPFPGVVIALASPSPAQSFNLGAALRDVIDLHVEVESYLALLGLGDPLERQPGCRVVPRPDCCPVGPDVLIGDPPIEHGAPERGQRSRSIGWPPPDGVTQHHR